MVVGVFEEVYRVGNRRRDAKARTTRHRSVHRSVVVDAVDSDQRSVGRTRYKQVHTSHRKGSVVAAKTHRHGVGAGIG